MARSIALDHDKKRSHILRVAARLFAAQGFARASMAQLAQAGAMSKANIYHYYNSKDDLLYDILSSYLKALRDRLMALQLDGKSPTQQLEMLVTDIMLAYEGMDAEHKLQTESLRHLPKDSQETLRDIQREIVGLFGGVLVQIVPADQRDDAKQMHFTVMALFGMVNWFYQWNSKAAKSTRTAYAKRICDIMLNGVSGPSG